MKRSLKIGILGTRGIPNRYGGFEQCAEYLALGLTQRGHKVWVYNSHSHEHQDSVWNGVHIIHCKDPEDKLGTAGQFIYDLNCINDARKRDYDILLQLGYTSSSVWYWRWPSHCKNIVNMDGLEWKRTKYSPKVQWFLKHAEKWAANHGDVLVADSIGIQQYLKTTYGKESHFIAYGSDIFESPDSKIIEQYELTPYNYHMLMARMEPENNIELIIKGYLQSGTTQPLLVVGKTGNAFGTYLVDTYSSNVNIKFAGGIYDTVAVNNLRYFSHLYFHGHTVGGTNPSLLEAMGSSALIAAHDNVFNKAVLGDDAYYFSNENDITSVIKNSPAKTEENIFIQHNLQKIRDQYNWQRITDQYEQLMLETVR